MIELNLLPDVKKDFIKAQRTRNQVVAISTLAIIGSVGLIIAFALFVYGGQKLIISNLTNDINKKSEELKKVDDLGKYLTVQNQLAHLDPLHEDKQVYSRLMDYLVVLNPVAPNSIQLDTLEVLSEDNAVVFKGTAPSAQAFNVYKDTLVNAKLSYSQDGGDKVTTNLFDDVLVEANALGRVRDQTLVSFIVRTTYNENVFVKRTDNVSVSVPDIETTQSYRQAPLFNSAAGTNGGAE